MTQYFKKHIAFFLPIFLCLLFLGNRGTVSAAVPGPSSFIVVDQNEEEDSQSDSESLSEDENEEEDSSEETGIYDPQEVYGESMEKILLRENHNGYKVFGGYKTGDLSSEELLDYAYERRHQINQERSSLSARSMRDTNFELLISRREYKDSLPPWERDKDFNQVAQEKIDEPSPLHSVAKRVSKLKRKEDVGMLKSAERTNKKSRYSLRHSQRQYGGDAEVFQNAKDQAQERREWESKVYAPNRVPDFSSSIRRSRIKIKNPDSRKKWLDVYKKSGKVPEEVAKEKPE
ncbi:hypothetical protein K9M59_02445 [Candidatus Gracilibacteria bacterium]|nr:hypothetical protein [Candidatus Gracilibacteria bacterium]MCF7819702.1 hypothetical protein [Candidatus Gracilibacteria bacterium]